MTPAEVALRLTGDPTYDMWGETKQLWFCGRVADIHSTIKRMKGPDYSAPLAKLKSSLPKALAALAALGGGAADYLSGAPIDPLPGVLPRFNVDGLIELQVFGTTAKRLLAMPKPDHLIELAIDLGEEPVCGYSGGDGPGGRRKWRNGVVTVMAHRLIEDADVPISRTGKSDSSEGSPSMKLMARVLDCLDPRKRRRTTDTVLNRVVRTKGKLTPKKPLKK